VHQNRHFVKSPRCPISGDLTVPLPGPEFLHVGLDSGLTAQAPLLQLIRARKMSFFTLFGTRMLAEALSSYLYNNIIITINIISSKTSGQPAPLEGGLMMEAI
jgi:hypothetical protein